jgi:hypothetical protein
LQFGKQKQKKNPQKGNKTKASKTTGRGKRKHTVEVLLVLLQEMGANCLALNPS